jgi:hypothetical protein
VWTLTFSPAELATLLRLCLVGGTSALVLVAMSWLLIWLELMLAALVNVAAIGNGIAAFTRGSITQLSKGRRPACALRPTFLRRHDDSRDGEFAFTHVRVENFRVSPYIVSTLVSSSIPSAACCCHSSASVRRQQGVSTRTACQFLSAVAHFGLEPTAIWGMVSS